MRNGLISVVASLVTALVMGAAHADPVATVGVDIQKSSSAKKLEVSYSFNSIVGTRNSNQYSDSSDSGAFSVAVSIMALNPDNTAHVVIDFEDAGQRQHVDATVPTNAAAEIASINSDVLFRLTVVRKPA
jgi:hypothetical protein